MEGMGGIEAARTLRQSGVDAVVIFITGIREYVFGYSGSMDSHADTVSDEWHTWFSSKNMKYHVRSLR